MWAEKNKINIPLHTSDTLSLRQLHDLGVRVCIMCQPRWKFCFLLNIFRSREGRLTWKTEIKMLILVS